MRSLGGAWLHYAPPKDISGSGTLAGNQTLSTQVFHLSHFTFLKSRLRICHSQGRYVLTTVSPELGWVKGLHYYAVSRGTRCPPFTGPRKRLFTNFLQCNKRLPQTETFLLGASSVCPGEPFADQRLEWLCFSFCKLHSAQPAETGLGFADADSSKGVVYI